MVVRYCKICNHFRNSIIEQTKDTSKETCQEETSKQSSEQEEPSEIDEDPMLSDGPQKWKDRSKLANPETSDKVNRRKRRYTFDQIL